MGIGQSIQLPSLFAHRPSKCVLSRYRLPFWRMARQEVTHGTACRGSDTCSPIAAVFTNNSDSSLSRFVVTSAHSWLHPLAYLLLPLHMLLPNPIDNCKRNHNTRYPGYQFRDCFSIPIWISENLKYDVIVLWSINPYISTNCG